jgi:hypothetical protein
MDYSPQAKSEDIFLPLAKSAVVLAGKGDVNGREGASPLVSERWFWILIVKVLETGSEDTSVNPKELSSAAGRETKAVEETQFFLSNHVTRSFTCRNEDEIGSCHVST